MWCDKCGGKTKVCNSRKLSTDVSSIPAKYYTQRDITYRSHTCVECNLKMKTVEMTVGDFDEIIKRAKASFLKELAK